MIALIDIPCFLCDKKYASLEKIIEINFTPFPSLQIAFSCFLGSSRIHVESNAEVHHFRTHSFLTGYQVQDTARWESKIQ
jgi:hypothetical protein